MPCARDNPPVDPAQRFSGRVGYYRRHRPSYPEAIVDLMASECGLRRESVLADVGSGTGHLSKLFLQRGNRVIGVEPNPEMRLAAEQDLKGYSGFVSVAGRAEATGLEDKSADFITAGQAFHWFNPEKARNEFRRVLKPGGWVVLVWNTRQLDTTPFLRAYEDLLQTFGTDYRESTGGQTDRERAQAFFDGSCRRKHFENRQSLALSGLEARLLSCSYVPAEGEPGYEAMLQRLAEVFEKHQSRGRVELIYATAVYFGRL